MESRKTPQADLAPKRPLFFHLGLVVALSLTIVAFEWKSIVTMGEVDVTTYDGNATTYVYVPNTVIEPPKPPKPQPILKPKVITLENIVESKDDNNAVDPIDFKFEIDENEIRQIMATSEPIIDIIDPPFDIVEEPAEFPGGEKALNKFLSKNLKYPIRAHDLKVEGTSYARFVIDKEGNVSDIEIIRGLGYGIDEEIIRVLKMSPKWKPAKQSHRIVKFRMVLPVRFNLK